MSVPLDTLRTLPLRACSVLARNCKTSSVKNSFEEQQVIFQGRALFVGDFLGFDGKHICGGHPCCKTKEPEYQVSTAP